MAKRKIKRSNLFFKQAIIFFGFFNGLWMAIGIDPEAIIFNFLRPLINSLGSTISYLFTILPTILLGISLYIIYKKGKWLGFAAVFCGFIGGLLILVSPKISIIFLLIAWIIGYFAINH